MTAHNLPIWKLLAVLHEMMDQGFERMDITVDDDLTISIKGIKQEDIKKIDSKEIKNKDINWEDTI